MSRRTVMIDDIDNRSEATETVRLVHNDVTYEVDLSEDNFTKMVSPLIQVARTVEAAPAPPTRITAARTRRPRGKAARDYDIDALRAWAAEKSVKLPARGRIPREIIEQFKQEAGG